VLAVGDIEFQKKALGKMEDVSKKDGRTILFVSHNLAAITNLCNLGIVLDRGSIAFQGDAPSSVSNYTERFISNNINDEDFTSFRSDSVRFISGQMLSSNGEFRSRIFILKLVKAFMHL
jgi:lipopolysaccharide transport system ATP-binding protein